MRDRPYTQSEIQTFRRCKRKWWLAWHRGLRLNPELDAPNAASLGTLVHVGLETLRAKGDWRAVLEERLETAQEIYELQPEKLAKFTKQYELAVIMIEGYIEWLEETGADEGIEFIAMERKVEVEVRGVKLKGKLDALIRDQHGRIMFLDDKTVGSMDEIPEKAPRDQQFLHYDLLLRHAFPDEPQANGGVWNMLRKVKRTARATPPFYGRHEYFFNVHQQGNYYAQLLQTIAEIEEHEHALQEGVVQSPSNLMYPTTGRDCAYFCPFNTICPMFDDGSRIEELISDMYIEANPLDRYDTEEESSDE